MRCGTSLDRPAAQQMVQLNASDLHVTRRLAARRAPARPSRALRRRRRADRRGHARPALPHPLDRAAEAARDQPPARLRALDPGRRPLPRQRLLPARDARRRVPPRSRTRSRRSRSSACRASLHQLAEKPRGLVLVTGPTGSGKSTTLASMIDEINRTRARPHPHDRGPDRVPAPPQGLHRQPARDRRRRDVVRRGLRGALRQDPDVILVGEMRDLETIATALTAAETGHLVFGTLHTQSAPGNDRPHHRRLPGRAAGAGARADRRHAAGRRHPGAAPDRRRPGPRARARDPAAGRRRPEPDPPGQGRADLLRHADRHRARACRRWSSRSPS